MRTFYVGIIFVILQSWSSGYTFAQKFGYVDTDFILSKVPEYKDAKQQINKLSTEWEKEIADKYTELQKLEAQLQSEEILLTKELSQEKREQLDKKWNELKEYQTKIFGHEGLFFLKKQEIIKPVQDKVYEAVEKVSKKHRLQIVFDKSGGLTLLYTNPIHDYTDYVLEALGLGDKNDTVN